MMAINVPRRETRTHNVNIGKTSQMHKLPPPPPTGGVERERPAVEQPDREVVVCENEGMETETPRADPTTGEGEELDSQDMLTDPQMSITNTEDQHVQPEGEAHGADRPETKPTQSDDGKMGKEAGCSPKRSKK